MRTFRVAVVAFATAILLLPVVPVEPAHAQAVREHPRVVQAVRLLEAWLEGQREYDRVPGISGAIVHDQEVVWQGGYGHADAAGAIPATPETVYSICSISKLFTSIAVMQLRDAGRLRLDDPVASHLPWFRIRRSDAAGPEITIEGLLTHSAGLPREAAAPYWSPPDFPFPSRDEIMTGLERQETLYPASRYFQYSNLGLSLAGEIVAAQSGRAYDDYIRSSILEPLQLSSTTPEMPESPAGTRLATGHSALTRAGTRDVLPPFRANGIAPAAGFASTAGDLSRFAAWQFRVLGGAADDVLAANTLREMHRVHWVDPDFDTYWGLGFSVRREGNRTFVGHGGSCPGYQTALLLQPDVKVAAIFMANASGVNAGQFAQRMYDIMAPAIAAASRDNGPGAATTAAAAEAATNAATPAGTPTAASDSALLRYAGRYSLAPWGGELVVLPWEEGLAVVALPGMNPVTGLTKLRRVDGDHTFRRVRKDDTLGETIVFEMGPDGRAVRFWQHDNPRPRIGGLP